MENVSEGQWLVSGLSEGEVRAPPSHPLFGAGQSRSGVALRVDLSFSVLKNSVSGAGARLTRPLAAGSEPDDTLYETDDLDQVRSCQLFSHIWWSLLMKDRFYRAFFSWRQMCQGENVQCSLLLTTQDVEHISEGEFLHRGAQLDPRLLSAMAELTNQPVRHIEQFLQQQQHQQQQQQHQPTRGILRRAYTE